MRHRNREGWLQQTWYLPTSTMVKRMTVDPILYGRAFASRAEFSQLTPKTTPKRASEQTSCS